MAQAMDGRSQSDLNYLTDCMHFITGNCHLDRTCPYRHRREAVAQAKYCQNWPQTCRNIMCSYRHPATASTIPQSSPQSKILVSIFWDIENVPIPRGQNPFTIVQRIRQKLIIESGQQEAQFSCYCNISKISEANQTSLHHANVRIVHVPDRKPGAADRQIMLDLARFERVHRPPATVVLISGDIDFVGTLSGLRHQAGFRVIVIHNKPAKEELKATVHEHYPWELFTEEPVNSESRIYSTINERQPRAEKPNRVRHPSRPRSGRRRDPSPYLLLPPNTQSSMVTNQQITKYQCPKCPNEFESIQSLRQHQTGKNHLFSCPVCTESFVTTLGQTQHQRDKNHYVLKYRCNQCNRYFAKFESLKQHQDDTDHRSSPPQRPDQNISTYRQNLLSSFSENDDSTRIILEGIEAIRGFYFKRFLQNK